MTTAVTADVLRSTAWATQQAAHPHTTPSDVIEVSNATELHRVTREADNQQIIMILHPRRNGRTVKVESPNFARMIADTIIDATYHGVQRFIIDSPYSMNHLPYDTITPLVDALTAIDAHLYRAGVDDVVVHPTCTTGARRSFRAVNFICQAVNGMGLQSMYYMPIYTIDLAKGTDALIDPVKIAHSTDLVRVSVAGGRRSLCFDDAAQFSPWCAIYAREVLWETGHPAVISYVQTGRRTSIYGLERFQYWCETFSGQEAAA